VCISQHFFVNGCEQLRYILSSAFLIDILARQVEHSSDVGWRGGRHFFAAEYNNSSVRKLAQLGDVFLFLIPTQIYAAHLHINPSGFS